MTVTRTPVSPCASCGQPLDTTEGVSDDIATPKPGDITVCLVCGHLAAFADDLTMRPLTREEQIEIAGNPDILAAQRARKAAGIGEP